jgi:hypothetical protein
MLNRFQPVAWMIATPDEPLSRSDTLHRQHRDELHRLAQRPSFLSRMIGRARGALTPTRVRPLDPACCPA